MKTSYIFVVSALVISTTFLSVLFLFGLPESIMEWLISDIILGAVLYINYLLIVMAHSSNKVKMYAEKKVAV